VGQAANALLKTLEEPPADTHFVLCTAEARRLPVTVLSRCQRLRFLPVDESQIVAWLVDENGAEPQAAQQAAQLAAGSPGRALRELEAGEDAERKKSLLARLRALLPRRVALRGKSSAEGGPSPERSDSGK